jgi:hypothetical protein
VAVTLAQLVGYNAMIFVGAAFYLVAGFLAGRHTPVATRRRKPQRARRSLHPGGCASVRLETGSVPHASEQRS